jgi:peptide/nickel transport system ATP-binding protein
MSAAPALLIDSLSVEFRTRSGAVKAVENATISVGRGETVAIVGESGSGKSVTAYAAMGILDPAGRVTAGRVMLGTVDLLSLRGSELAERRGREIAMIFQNPRTALNPIRAVGQQIADVLVRHGKMSRTLAAQRVFYLLQAFEIDLGDWSS